MLLAILCTPSEMLVAAPCNIHESITDQNSTYLRLQDWDESSYLWIMK